MKYHMDIDRNTTTLLYYLWYAWKMKHASRAICFLRMLRFYLCPILCTFIIILIINPRRACARVTVLVLCVSLCVCVFSLFWHLAQSGVQTAVSATSARYGHEI